MKKFVVFIVSFVLLMNIACITVFGASNPGGADVGGDLGGNTETVTDAYAELASSYYMGRSYSPEELMRVSVNSTFTSYIAISSFSGTSYDGWNYELNVSGSGFAVDGSSANRRGVYNEGRTIPVPIRVDSTVATGMHSLTLSIILTDGVESVTVSQAMNVYVMGTTEAETPDNSNGSVVFDITAAPNSSVYAGDTFGISFSAYLSAVYNVTGATQGVLSVSGEGFSLAGSLAEQNIVSGTNTATLLVDKKVETGRHQITLTVTFTVGAEKYTASRSLNIDVINTNATEEVDESKDNASFKLASASIPEKSGKKNLATKLSLAFENTTEFTATNVKITLSTLDEVLLNTYTDTVDVGEVEGGHRINATFPIKFPEKIVKPQQKLGFTVSYDSPAGHQEENFNVYIQSTVTPEEETSEAETASLTPRVIISQYSVDVDEVISGEVFTLSFILKNTSAEKDLRNMKIDVTPMASESSSAAGTSSGPVFSFTDGTSSFYTDILEKNGTLEYSIKLKCSASAGAGTYPIMISYKFEYAEGKGYMTGDDSMSINIPVKQPVKFDLLDWVPPTECGLEGTTISFQYFNKSRNPMTNLTISMEGDFTMPPQSVATLNASNADYFTGNITPKEGAQVGDVLHAILVFTFEDAAGEEQRKEETFDVNIIESAPVEEDFGMWDAVDPGIMYDENGMPITGENVEERGLPLWAKIAIPAGAAVVVIGGTVAVVKKVKKKKSAEDDEE